VFALVGSNVLVRAATPVVLERGFEAFPRELGSWSASASVRQADAATPWSGADAELRRRYRRADGATADLFIGYFASQPRDREMVTHRSSELHSRATVVRVAPAGGAEFAANYAAARRGRPELLFWYELDAAAETNRYRVKALTLWNAAWRARTNGAVVALTGSADANASQAAALQELAGLVRNALAATLRDAGAVR
jgi:EpsI family protein